MKWIRFLHEGVTGFGLLDGDSIHTHSGNMYAGPQATGDVLKVSDVQYLPPCNPGKIVGLWNNFKASAEKNGWAVPMEPLYFLKSPSSVASHNEKIPVPVSYTGRVAYEGELCIVIGQTARNVTVEESSKYIFGYTCGNDVTALEILGKDASFTQWTRAKSFEGFSAIGPMIETVFEPDSALLKTMVAGRERQNYSLADMFFNPFELVSRISHDMVLEPGDVIFCGTSLGVLPMKPGTQVDIVIDQIGTLSNVYG
jgi:2-keto-4-pentenoate hydratase/2-oxohepta-3-ene-1,7-dioic acid hydratase in catechol pathway